MAHLILWTGVDQQYPIRTGGAYQLASWCRSFGYSVKVIDFCNFLTTEELVSITEDYIDNDTIAIGINSGFWTLGVFEENGVLQRGCSEPSWLLSAKPIVKEKYPKLEWLLGGANSARTTIKGDYIRFHQYGENQLIKWLDEKTNTNIPRPEFDIKNFVKQYDESDKIKSHEVLSIELGRGCIFKCKFCDFPMIGKKRGTYERSQSDIYAELMYNYEHFGTTKYFYTDDTVNESENKVKMLADIAQSLPFEIEWMGFLRADLIWSKPQTAQWLKDSGLKSAYFGIETFNNQSSKVIGKGWSGSHARNWLLGMKDTWRDINWDLSMITGLPGWTPDELIENTTFMIENDMHCWNFYSLDIRPNRSISNWHHSEFDIHYEKYGYRFNENDMYNWIMGDITREEVERLSTEANEISYKHKKIAGWELGLLSNYTTSMAELMNIKSVDFNYDAITQKSKIFLREYIGKNV